jgi:hypothetical protein
MLEERGHEPADAGAALVDEQPLLFDGQRLDQPTFHALYLQTPAKFKAELIDGVVHVMSSPVYDDHSESDALFVWILGSYAAATPGVTFRSNPTAILGPRSEVQPDSALLIEPEFGGQTKKDERGCRIGSPELVVEISASSLSIDLHAKRRAYEEAGALEYVVFDASHRRIHWFALRDGRFEVLTPDPEGIFRSGVFPGLWLDPAALLSKDQGAITGCLNRGLASPEHGDFVGGMAEERAKRR